MASAAQRFLRLGHGGGGGTGAANKVRMGVNLPSYPTYGTDPGPLNLFLGGLLETSGGGTPTTDSLGWPTQDCVIGNYTGPETGAPYTIFVQFTGQAGAAAFLPGLSEGGSSLSSLSYSGTSTNTTTFNYVYDPTVSNVPPHISLTGTKRLPTDSPGTGITNIYMWKAADVGNTTQVWSSDLAALITDFGTLRTMDIQGIIGDHTTTDWNTGTATLVTKLGSVVNLVKLANQFSKDLWMQIPINATNDWMDNFFTYLKNNLNSSQKIMFGYANEDWNPGGSGALNYLTAIKAGTELRGAVGDNGFGSSYGRTVTATSVTSGVNTWTVSFTPEITVGEHIVVTGNGNVEIAVTVTGVNTGAKTFTFNSSLNFGTGGSGTWYVSSDVVSTLNPVSDLTYNIYGLGFRYAVRQIALASARCRAIVGDSAMMTRFRPIMEIQGVNNTAGADDLAYLSAYLGGDSLVKNCIYAFGGAPYFDTNGAPYGGVDLRWDTATHTQADYLAQFTLTAAAMKTAFYYAQQKVLAIQYGIQICSYESGPDVATGDGSDGNADIGAPNRVTRNASKFSAGFGTIYTGFLHDVGMCGFDLLMHYSAAEFAATSSSIFTWGYTDTPSDVTPWWQAIRTYNAAAPSSLPTLNPVSLTVSNSAAIDGRSFAGQFGTPSGSYPGLRSTGNSADYLITVVNAGTYSLVLHYAADFTFGTAWTFWANGVQVGSYTPSVTGGDLSGGIDSSAISMTLPAGICSVQIKGTGGGGANNEAFKLLTFTRTA